MRNKLFGADSYQCIKDKDIVLITVGMFHHDVKQGIQCILEKLQNMNRQTDNQFNWKTSKENFLIVDLASLQLEFYYLY